MKFSCVKHVNCSKNAVRYCLQRYCAIIDYCCLISLCCSKAIEMRVEQYYVIFFSSLSLWLFLFPFHSVRFPMNQSILNYFIYWIISKHWPEPVSVFDRVCVWVCMFVLELHGKLAAVFFSEFFSFPFIHLIVVRFGFWSSELCVTIVFGRTQISVSDLTKCRIGRLKNRDLWLTCMWF